jgi:enoyl-CoA hydratase/carnithine racemase
MSHIRYEVSDRVATVAIDRPEKRNALTFALLAELDDAIRRAGHDDRVGAVELTVHQGLAHAGLAQ